MLLVSRKTRRASLWAGTLLSLALIAGCRNAENGASPASVASFPARPHDAAGAKLAYSHTLTIDIAAVRLAEHFATARDRCLGDAALHCVLLESRIEQDQTGAAAPRARLQVRLPHETVPTYVAAVTAPLPAEPAASVVVRAQGTRAEDLSRPIEDGARRLAQLTDYRGRLAELAARPDTKVDDLIKIAAEVSRTQAAIEAAEAQQRGLITRVETEVVTIDGRRRSNRLGLQVSAR